MFLQEQLSRLSHLLWSYIPIILTFLWHVLQALTPIVSSATAIVALRLSSHNSKNIAQEAEAKRIREARAVAFAISPSVNKIMTDAMMLKRTALGLIEGRRHLVGQSVAGEVSILTIQLPTLLDRYIERLGSLPDNVGRWCIDLVSLVQAFNENTHKVAGSVGLKDGGLWHYEVMSMISKMDDIITFADGTHSDLEDVMSLVVPGQK